MGWQEFLAWLRTMKEELEERQVAPDSWKGAESDPWWQEARRQRYERQNRT